MLKCLCAGITAFALIFWSFAASAEDYILTGSFENPLVPEGGKRIFRPGDSVSRWDVICCGSVSLIEESYTEGGFTFETPKGKQFIDLTGYYETTARVSLIKYVRVPVVPLTLTLSIGTVYDPDGTLGVCSKVYVSVEGEARILRNCRIGPPGTMVWRRFAINFIPKSNKTRIWLRNADPANDGMNAVDNVRLSRTSP